MVTGRPTGRPRLNRDGDRPGTRRCSGCKESVPVEDFHVDRARFDGLTTWCNTCRNAGRRGAFAANLFVEHARIRAWKLANPDKVTEHMKRWRTKRRQMLLDHYGGSCACCGEIEWRFLAIDHINGGGTRHRAEVGKGDAFFQWLIREGLPEGFRVLCHNCNLAIGFYSECPHGFLSGD